MILATAADGSQTQTDYAIQTSPSKARVVTVTDPATVQRKLKYDAFDRLTEVDETSAGYMTLYSYDKLDNLTGVTQGSQSRHFTYDSLRRLLTANNPETGLASFEYDANGNLVKRTAGAITTCYGTLNGSNCQQAYDSLNRPTKVTYSDSTPPKIFCYDGFVYSGGGCANQVAGQKMRRTGSGNSVASTSYTYDQAGRPIASTQKMGISYPFTYTYYNDDRLASVQYPSGRTVITCYDANGRVSWVSANLTVADCPNNPPVDAGATYARVDTWWPHGAARHLTLGNGLVETVDFNNRLQVLRVQAATLLSLNYDYGTSNNGNVRQQTISIPAAGKTYYQYYSYDGTNRLLSASEYGNSPGSPACPDNNGQWCEKYDYGQWGNRRIVDRSHLTPSLLEAGAYDAATNRAMAGAMGGTFSYTDGRGNVNKDALGATYTYDAENRLIAYCQNGQIPCTEATVGATSYNYDAEGRRVLKKTTAGTTAYVYDGEGMLAAEYGAGTAAGTQYLTQDALGSTRLITDSSGNPVERRDYYPFGGTIIPTTANGRMCDVPANCPALGPYLADIGVSVQFTGKERDAETGLDYFGARYFSGAQGRFTSPDPKQFPHDITDPQSWNKYGYTRNNPLRYVDPDGEDWQDYLKGAINAFTSNNAAGAGRIGGGNGDFRTGQAIGDAVSTVTGTLETLAGAGGEVLGGALDLTGVGAVIGVPVNVVAAGVIAHGATTGIVSGVHLVQDANEATSSGSSNSKPEQIADQIEKGGYQVQQNPKTGTQEGTVTISHPSQPGEKVNVRVETHPLKPGGPPVRHANVETVKPGPKNRPEVVDNTHIDH